MLHIAYWLAASLWLLASCLFGWMGITYFTEGFGLHPALATAGVLVSLGLCWLSATLADRTERL